MELSDKHIAAANHQRRVIVNYDTLCGFGPFICDGVTPQQIVDYRFSLLDHREHAIDSVMWCFGEGTTDPGSWDTQDLAYAEPGRPERYATKDKTVVIGRRGGGVGANKMALEISPAPEDWRTPRWGLFDTNAFAQLPAPIANKDDLDTFLTLCVGDDVNGHADRINRIVLRVLLSDAAAQTLLDEQRLEPGTVRARYTKLGFTTNIPPAKGIGNQIQVRINGVLLGRGSIEQGWLTFDVQAKCLNHGRNLIGIRAKGRGDVREQMLIEKVELDVNYR